MIVCVGKARNGRRQGFGGIIEGNGSAGEMARHRKRGKKGKREQEVSQVGENVAEKDCRGSELERAEGCVAKAGVEGGKYVTDRG